MAKERQREKERKRDRKGETLNHLSIHQWVRSAIFASHQFTSPIGFPFLKLPPPPCAVLLVYNFSVYIYIYIIGFSGIPNNRNVLFLQIFLKRSAKPNAGTTPQRSPKPPRPSPEPSLEPCWTWPGSAPKPPDLLRNLRNLLWNLVELDPAPAPVHTGAILGWRPH